MDRQLENVNEIYIRFNYIEENVLSLKVKMDYSFSGVYIKNVIVPPNFVLSEKEEKYLVYFTQDNEISLKEYINKKGDLKVDEIINIILNIGNLIKAINDKGYILGSIDLEDIWLVNEDINTLFIRQRKALFEENRDNNLKYNCSSISAFAVKNERYLSINKNTDLELYGRIFMSLIIPNRVINDYKELRYLSYNIRLFNNNIPLFLQTWLNKITSIYEDKRFKNIQDAINYIKDNCDKKQMEITKSCNNEEKNLNIPKYLYSCITHPGKGKIKKLTEEKLNCIDNINQDSLFIHEHDNKIFAMVADGISNCTYGSGYKASKIIEKVCKDKVIKNMDLIDEDNIWDFYKNLISESNEEICNKIIELYPSDNEDIFYEDIMGSTFVSCFIKDNKAFISSIGDSKAFIYRNNTVFQINTEDNMGNECLKNGMSWKDYLDLNRSLSLTKYIGNMGEDISHILTPQMIEIDLQQGDIIIICSDGLTDYIYDLGSKGDLWNVNESIGKIIEKNYHSNLGYINWKLVQRANYNGGWDNISSILIKIN